MRIQDVETSYHNGTRGLPMVNVKNHRAVTDEAIVDVVREYVDDPRVTAMSDDDVAATVRRIMQDDYRWEEAATESCWDDAQDLARETFGDRVKVWAAGRSGGWCVVEGLPPVPDPDDIDPDDPNSDEAWWLEHVDDWATFADGVRDIANDWPTRAVGLLALNAPELIAGRVVVATLTIIMGDEDLAANGTDASGWDWASMLELGPDSTVTVRQDR